MEITKVGVVGCGIMGSGITVVCAQSGYQTVVWDLSDELIAKGIASIDQFLSKSVEKGKIALTDKSATLQRIRGTTAMEDFADCDLVIEAVTEFMDIKKKVFSELNKICIRPNILASNTSSLSIIEMAMVTKRPENVLGIHFGNPAPLMKVVEIVKSIRTDTNILNDAIKFVKSLDKQITVSQDRAGFIGNRLLIPFLLDAIRMVESNFATKEDIDKHITLSLNHPMGPLALADFIGLDTVYFIAVEMYENLILPELAPPPLLKNMVVAGWLGRKTRKGFYEY